MVNTSQFSRAGFLKRLAAIIYDWLVAIAVGMVAAMVILLILMICFSTDLIQHPDYSHFSDFIQHSVFYTVLIQIWVALWISAFFAWFWRNGGQTIGMRAWRLRLFTTDDTVLSYPRVIARMITSLLGLGTLLVLFDVKHKLALQDRITRTQVLVLSKDANDHKQWKDI